MSQHSLFKLVNFIWFQSIWVIAILWQNQYLGLLAILLVLHLVITANKKAELSLWVIGGSIGIAIDGTLTQLAFFIFPTPSEWLPIPWWLVIIWLAFLGTLRHSLGYLLTKPRLACALGAVFAPISYFAGMRLGAVEFGRHLVTTGIVLAASWAIFMPLLVRLNAEIDKFWHTENQEPTSKNAVKTANSVSE